jgi:hypothetical protein
MNTFSFAINRKPKDVFCNNLFIFGVNLQVFLDDHPKFLLVYCESCRIFRCEICGRIRAAVADHLVLRLRKGRQGCKKDKEKWNEGFHGEGV